IDRNNPSASCSVISPSLGGCDVAGCAAFACCPFACWSGAAFTSPPGLRGVPAGVALGSPFCWSPGGGDGDSFLPADGVARWLRGCPPSDCGVCSFCSPCDELGDSSGRGCEFFCGWFFANCCDCCSFFC